MRIVIAPYATKLRNGKENPKNYCYWPQLVSLLKKEGYEVVQIGASYEAAIDGVHHFFASWPFPKLKELIQACDLWISVDSWLPHFAHCEKLKPGIVLFGQSDPRIWGYPENKNILRGRDFLRRYQYDTWEAAEDLPQAFVYAEHVLAEVRKLAPIPYVPPPLLLTADLYPKT